MKYDNLPKIYSFDVFDTCLTRTYAHPTDLLYELAQLVLVEKDKNYSQVEFYQLGKHRMLAEKRARHLQKKYREDISIDQIYLNFSELEQWGIDPQYMLEIELRLEEKSIYPIKIIKSRIEELRKKNNEIIFVSDMYLPTQFIKKCLLNHGLAEEKDSIYVSGDIGLTKHSGSLFKHILQQKNCKPEDIFHIGDNLVADFKIPGKLGINAELFEDIQLTRYEKTIARDSTIPAGVASRISGVSRISRLNSIATDTEKELAQLASNVIAPLLISFVSWVLRDAKKNNFEQLYFVSRDGQILYKIAQKIVEHQSIPIECRYLYGSRQAWFSPSIVNASQCNRNHLDWLLMKGMSTAPRDILHRLNIEPEEIWQFIEQYNFLENIDQQLSMTDIENFWNFIEDPRVSSIIVNKAQKNRLLAIDYFQQEGLLSPSKKWALIDIGWTLKSQRALKKILGCNYLKEIHGYYFGVREHSFNTEVIGTYSAFIEEGKTHLITNKCHDWLFKKSKISIIEDVFTVATHPTVIGYCEKDSFITPIFKEEAQDSSQANHIQKTILFYTDQILDAEFLKDNLNHLVNIAIHSLYNFFHYPLKEDVQSIADCSTCIEQTHDINLYSKIARPLNKRDLFLILRTELTKKSSSSIPLWLEGSAALSSTPIKQILMLFLESKKFFSSI